MAIRPERARILPAPDPAAGNCFQGKVEFVSFMGGSVDIHVQLTDSDQVIAQVINAEDQPIPQAGDSVWVCWSPSASVFARHDEMQALAT
jgi:putative spermidine/putrescine transport system ATP-binding protein